MTVPSKLIKVHFSHGSHLGFISNVLNTKTQARTKKDTVYCMYCSILYICGSKKTQKCIEVTLISYFQYSFIFSTGTLSWKTKHPMEHVHTYKTCIHPCKCAFLRYPTLYSYSSMHSSVTSE